MLRLSAFRLAREGYDVWLGNVRGTAYSREHVKLNPDEDMAFWDYRYFNIIIEVIVFIIIVNLFLYLRETRPLYC